MQILLFVEPIQSIMQPDQPFDLSNDVAKIPSSGGSYALALFLPASRRVQIGRLGKFVFSAGVYVYLGSAGGSGGLRARLGRHLRGAGRPHWHIDNLRKAARVSGYCFLESTDEGAHASDNAAASDLPTKMECRWSLALAAMPGTSTPAPGFGATDCRSGCPAHLFRLPDDLTLRRLRATLAASAGVSHQALICSAGFLR